MAPQMTPDESSVAGNGIKAKQRRRSQFAGLALSLCGLCFLGHGRARSAP